MSYFDFLHKVDTKEIKIIFELGSRDLLDAIKLLDYFAIHLGVFNFYYYIYPNIIIL